MRRNDRNVDLRMLSLLYALGIEHWSFDKFSAYSYEFVVHPNSYEFIRFTIARGDIFDVQTLKWSFWYGFQQVSRETALAEMHNTKLVD